MSRITGTLDRRVPGFSSPEQRCELSTAESGFSAPEKLRVARVPRAARRCGRRREFSANSSPLFSELTGKCANEPPRPVIERSLGSPPGRANQAREGSLERAPSEFTPPRPAAVSYSNVNSVGSNLDGAASVNVPQPGVEPDRRGLAPGGKTTTKAARPARLFSHDSATGSRVTLNIEAIVGDGHLFTARPPNSSFSSRLDEINVIAAAKRCVRRRVA